MLDYVKIPGKLHNIVSLISWFVWLSQTLI